MVVEARPSAGGSIGAAHVARSPADDFSGIVELVNAPVVALVPASLPVRTLKEFVE